MVVLMKRGRHRLQMPKKIILSCYLCSEIIMSYSQDYQLPFKSEQDKEKPGRDVAFYHLVVCHVDTVWQNRRWSSLQRGPGSKWENVMFIT